jgi:hypothetical protein
MIQFNLIFALQMNMNSHLDAQVLIEYESTFKYYNFLMNLHLNHAKFDMNLIH